MKELRKIIHIDEDLCDGCAECVPSCEEGAIEIRGGKARLVAERYCDGLGACLGECPTGALTLVEEEADPFDEEAVRARLRELETGRDSLACGCPGSKVARLTPGRADDRQGTGETPDPALSTWPVQIRLVPPDAPFLGNADLLVAADCVPVAAPAFHTRFLPGRVALIGCPKFDDVQGYVEKFTDMFRANDIASVTILEMEVPCCLGLHRVVARAAATAGVDVPLARVVVGRDGAVGETSHIEPAAAGLDT